MVFVLLSLHYPCLMVEHKRKRFTKCFPPKNNHAHPSYVHLIHPFVSHPSHLCLIHRKWTMPIIYAHRIAQTQWHSVDKERTLVCGKYSCYVMSISLKTSITEKSWHFYVSFHFSSGKFILMLIKIKQYY